jgi:hypothetical protein
VAPSWASRHGSSIVHKRGIRVRGKSSSAPRPPPNKNSTHFTLAPLLVGVQPFASQQLNHKRKPELGYRRARPAAASRIRRMIGVGSAPAPLSTNDVPPLKDAPKHWPITLGRSRPFHLKFGLRRVF